MDVAVECGMWRDGYLGLGERYFTAPGTVDTCVYPGVGLEVRVVIGLGVV